MKIPIYQILFGFVIIVFLNSCSKDNKEPATCDEKMIAKFSSQITCSVERGIDAIDNVLAKGSYDGQVVYFMYIRCARCNSVSPQEGYICSKDFKIEKITIQDFNSTVKELSIVKGCGD